MDHHKELNESHDDIVFGTTYIVLLLLGSNILLHNSVLPVSKELLTTQRITFCSLSKEKKDKIVLKLLLSCSLK